LCIKCIFSQNYILRLRLMFVGLFMDRLFARRYAWSMALAACVLGFLVLQFKPSHTPRDRAMVEEVQTHLHFLESNVSATLLDRNFFRSLIEVMHGQGSITNDLIDKMRVLSG